LSHYVTAVTTYTVFFVRKCYFQKISQLCEIYKQNYLRHSNGTHKASSFTTTTESVYDFSQICNIYGTQSQKFPRFQSYTLSAENTAGLGMYGEGREGFQNFGE